MRLKKGRGGRGIGRFVRGLRGLMWVSSFALHSAGGTVVIRSSIYIGRIHPHSAVPCDALNRRLPSPLSGRLLPPPNPLQSRFIFSNLGLPRSVSRSHHWGSERSLASLLRSTHAGKCLHTPVSCSPDIHYVIKKAHADDRSLVARIPRSLPPRQARRKESQNTRRRRTSGYLGSFA